MAPSNNLSFGLFSEFGMDKKTGRFGKSRFGELTVPNSMRPVSDFRKSSNVALVAPFGPPGKWLADPSPAARSSSSMYGRKTRNAIVIDTNTRIRNVPDGYSGSRHRRGGLNNIRLPSGLSSGLNNIRPPRRLPLPGGRSNGLNNARPNINFNKLIAPKKPLEGGITIGGKGKGKGNSFLTNLLNKEGNKFGRSSLAGRKVTPAGYLAIQYGQPRTVPPSWNPLLLQGNNNFVTSPGYPTLSDVSAFGARRRRATPTKRAAATKRRATPTKRATATKRRATPAKRATATKRRATPAKRATATKRRVAASQDDPAAKRRAKLAAKRKAKRRV